MDTYAGYGMTTAVGGGSLKMAELTAQIPNNEQIIDINNVASYENKKVFEGLYKRPSPA